MGYAMRYKVNIKRTDEGYSVWVPGLPGCWSQGKTKEEAIENIKDAIQVYLETVNELRKQNHYYGIKIKDANLTVVDFKSFYD